MAPIKFAASFKYILSIMIEIWTFERFWSAYSDFASRFDANAILIPVKEEIVHFIFLSDMNVRWLNFSTLVLRHGARWAFLKFKCNNSLSLARFLIPPLTVPCFFNQVWQLKFQTNDFLKQSSSVMTYFLKQKH